jgi:hypothetical protein
VYGASAQRGLGEGVLSLEAGFYRSEQDTTSRIASLPGSQWRFLAGYQRHLRQDLHVGVQTYNEVLPRPGASGPRHQDRIRNVLSVRVTQLLQYQTWTLSTFAAYSPTDRDYFLKPEVMHKFTDHVSLSIGGHVFGGQSPMSFFGQFDKNDNVFINVRFDW